jgi:PAS domain S-box-containing protein
VVGEEIGREIETRYRECVECRETIEYPEEIPVDGEMRHWKTKLTPVLEDGSVVELVGAMRDVTERKAHQQPSVRHASGQSGS